MTLILVDMYLPAVCVLFQIETTNYERNPFPIWVYLGIGRDDEQSEILRPHS